MPALFSLGLFASSETFYCVAIPASAWSFAEGAHLPMFVTFFAANIYVGNWLKNLFALPRAATTNAVPNTDDFAWPSIHALNSVALPFFAMRLHSGLSHWPSHRPNAAF